MWLTYSSDTNGANKRMTFQLRNTLSLLIVLICFELILREDMADVMSLWLMNEESFSIY